MGNGYRYGFNGKELDQERMGGGGSTYDYGFRIYNPQLGRFLSVDPLTKSYPMLTPYQFASNKPIDGIDLDGLEYYSIHIKEDANGNRTKIGLVNYTNLKDGYGSKGPGVEYVIHKYNDDGEEVGKSSFMITNLHGVYQGGNNPRKYWEKPDENGNYPYDYSLTPIDETDAATFQHDLDYDRTKMDNGKVGAEGLEGVISHETGWVDDKYVISAYKIIEKYDKKEIDKYTGKPVSEATKNAAEFGKGGFNAAKPFKSQDKILKKDPNFFRGPKY